MRVSHDDGLIASVSDTMEELFGVKPESVMGKHIGELLRLHSSGTFPAPLFRPMLVGGMPA